MDGSPMVRNKSDTLNNKSVVIFYSSSLVIVLCHAYQMGGTAHQFLHLFLGVNVTLLTLGILQLIADARLMQIGNVLADDIVLA